MDTREWKERFDSLKPDERLEILMHSLARRAETPAQMRDRHMVYLQMLAIVGVSTDEALDCQTIKPDAFKTLHFKKPKFEWPHITLALPISKEPRDKAVEYCYNDVVATREILALAYRPRDEEEDV